MSDDSTLENELLSGDSGNGVKRPNESTTNEGPEPKKSNVSSADRELKDDEIRESFPIPDQLVGLVIGRGGENITRIQTKTLCEIQVQPHSNGSDNRPCTLTGKPETVAEAKKMLQDTIVNGQLKDEENKKQGKATPSNKKSKTRKNRQGGNNNQNQYNHGNQNHSNQWGSVTEEFLVPPDKIGVAIGKGGQNLKNLRTKFSVQLELIQNETEPAGVAKPLKITGSLQQINACRMECFQNMLAKEEKTPPKLAPGAQVRSDFPVPQDAVGVIIGKKGETITNLQGETVTRIQFQPEDKSQKTRGCYITGSMDGVMRAQQIVLSICRKKMTGQETKQTFGPPAHHGPPVQQNMQQPGPMGAPMPNMQMPGQHWGPRPPMQSPYPMQGQNTGMPYGQPPQQQQPSQQQEQKVDYPVPSNKTGAVIGKGGEHIIGIKQKTGCQITQNKSNPPTNDPQWKYFTIQGPADKVAMAQKLIQERVGGPPPPNASYNQRMPPNSPGQQGLLGHGPPRPMTQPGFQGPPPQFNNAPPNLAPPVMPTPPMQSPPGYPSGAPPVVPHNSGQYHNYQQQPPQQPPQPAMPQAPPPAPTTPAAPTNNPDHSAAWAAYYQSMYQQQQQTRPAAPATSTNQGAQPDYTKAWEEYFKQQQAAGTATPSSSAQPSQPAAQATSNNSNGQTQDYSAAWAEYYKTMGQYQQYYQQQRT